MQTQAKIGKKRKISGFWIRFLAKGIDIILILTLTIVLSLPNLQLQEPIVFLAPWNFYLWAFLTFFLWPCYFIGLPLLTNGYTCGLFICKLKLEFTNVNKKQIFKVLLKREVFFSLLIAFNFLMLIIFINHSLVNRFFQMNQDDINYSTMEGFRISVTTIFLSISIFLQMIVGISIIVKNGLGINDRYSNSKIVYRNRFEISKKNSLIVSKKYKPQLVEQEIIEWVD